METIMKFMKEKKKEFVGTVIFASIGAILSIIPFVIIYRVIELFITSSGKPEIQEVITLLVLALIIYVLKYLFTITSFVFSHIAAFDLLYNIRTTLTSHLGKLPMGYWTKNSSGKVRKIIQQDVERVELFVAHHLPDVISGSILPIATIIFLATINWKMALVTMIPLPIGFIMVKLMWSGIAMNGKSREELWKSYHESMEGMHSTIVEFVEGMPVIKAFNITAHSFERLKSAVLKYSKLTVKMSKTQTPFYAVFTAMTIGGGLFIIPFGLHFLKAGQLSVGAFLLFLTLGTGCFHQFVKVMMITGHMELIFAGGRRIGSILEEDALVEPVTPAIPVNSSIDIRNLDFHYDKASKQILHNISLSFPERSFTAIVGPSGSGKSTLVNLIARMWDTANDSIFIGQKNIKDIGTEGINEIVGTVFQEVFILTDSIMNNIKMNLLDCPDEEVIEAAKAANCYDFIMKLPRGFETIIGDGGEVHLSGGEKQRISLARVILKKAEIVLLDEASCYADAENEVKMQESFSRVMQGKTVIVIAHRLSTIVKADNIVVLNNGRVEEQGTHEQLLKKHGLFAEMWKIHTRSGEWSINEENEDTLSIKEVS